MSYCEIITNNGYDCFEFGIITGFIIVGLGMILFFISTAILKKQNQEKAK